MILLMKNSYQLYKINKSLKRIKDSKIRERLLMLKTYYGGASLRVAGDHYVCSYGTIKHWKDRYEAHGLRGVRPRQRSGAPRKLNQEKALEIKREIVQKTAREGGWQAKQIREYIQEKAGVTYSIRHTVRIAQEWGLSHITPRPQYVYAKEADKKAFLKEKRGNTLQ